MCLPWFGPHQEDPTSPQHGFARNLPWELVSTRAIDAGCTELVLCLKNFRQHPHPQFPHCFEAQLKLILTDSIELELKVSNCGDSPMPLSWALHSYHPVSDLDTASIKGLAGCHYRDATDGGTRKLQSADVCFAGEVDRLFDSVPAAQRILSRQSLEISADNCKSAIVWNPGEQLAANMADISERHYREFVCLERGNAGSGSLLLAAKQTHMARVRIRAV